jgi:curved DNA-binding protein CbpA
MSDESLLDYYEDLQVSPKADQETIERVFRMFAKRYHPDNGHTGCIEKFDKVAKAYQILNDPTKRAAYDLRYEEIQKRKWRLTPDATSFSNRNGKDAEIRNGLLSVLYIERRNDPASASVGLWQLEKILGWPEKVLEFHTWYLKEKGWIQRTDSGGYAITATGVDAFEKSDQMTGNNNLLPERTIVSR